MPYITTILILGYRKLPRLTCKALFSGKKKELYSAIENCYCTNKHTILPFMRTTNVAFTNRKFRKSIRYNNCLICNSVYFIITTFPVLGIPLCELSL